MFCALRFEKGGPKRSMSASIHSMLDDVLSSPETDERQSPRPISPSQRSMCTTRGGQAAFSCLFSFSPLAAGIFFVFVVLKTWAKNSTKCPQRTQKKRSAESENFLGAWGQTRRKRKESKTNFPFPPFLRHTTRTEAEGWRVHSVQS